MPALGISDGFTTTVGAAGLFSGPLRLSSVAVLLILVPGSVPGTTVTSNTTVTELLAGTEMLLTLTMPLALAPEGGAENRPTAPAGSDTKPPKVTSSGMSSVIETLRACPPALSVIVMV